MFRGLLLGFTFLLTSACYAQLQVSKLVGKNSGDYSLGYGGFLKFSYPIIESWDITIEVGANIFKYKPNTDYGIATLPLKAGFRYTLNQTGAGFYVEPQLGYNIIGVDEEDNKFNGPVVAGGAGYLFEPWGGVQFDLGLLFESAIRKDGSINYVSLRLTHNFSFGRRESNYY